MAFLTLVTLLCSMVLGADGTYYNCSKLSAQSETDPVKIAQAQDNCTNTYWCIWESLNKECTYDNCLKYVADDAGADACPTTIGGLSCTLYYAVDSINCTSGADLQTNRYCRVATGYEKKVLVEADCFYDDLKSINGATEGATRACGNKVCNWFKRSGYGDYCDNGGGQDCSAYTQAEDICPCLGKDHCDLYPRCIVSSSNCIPDPCNKAYPAIGAAAGDNCRIGVQPAPGCTARIEWTYDATAGTLNQTLFCTNASTTPNECYGAVKSTLIKPTQSDGEQHQECWYYDYDESICNQAKALDEKASPPVVPATDPKSCQLVDIAGGYFSATKYCTDGDRDVPSPNGASPTHIPLFLGLVALAFVSLL